MEDSATQRGEHDRKQIIRLCAESNSIPFNRLDLLIPNTPNTSGVYQGAPPRDPKPFPRPQNARDMLNNLGNSPAIISAFHKQMKKTPPKIKVPSGSNLSAQQSYLNTAFSFGKGLARNVFTGNSADGLIAPDGEVISDSDERFDDDLVPQSNEGFEVLDSKAKPEDFVAKAPELVPQPQQRLPDSATQRGEAEFELEEDLVDPEEFVMEEDYLEGEIADVILDSATQRGESNLELKKKAVSKSQKNRARVKRQTERERGTALLEPRTPPPLVSYKTKDLERFEMDRPSPLDMRMSGGLMGRRREGRLAGLSREYRDPKSGFKKPLGILQQEIY
jgi:hypothetical protein